MNLVRLSKLMSHALRHAPEEYGLVLDGEGWTPLEELVEALRPKRPDLTPEQVEAVVREIEPDKARFAIASPPGGPREIRANYGHSLPGKIQQAEAEPPAPHPQS